MKRNCLLLITALFSLSIYAQNEKVINDANAIPRSVEPFHSIQVEDGIDLYLAQGNVQAVAVSANKEEYRNQIITNVENGVLKIFYKEQKGFSINWRDRKMRAYISAKTIDNIKASGGSDIIVQGAIITEKLSLDLSGGSDFVGDVKITELLVDISGGADVRIRGTATNLKLEGSGGSDFIGYDLQAEYAVVTVSGGSDAQLSVSKELFAEASGGSDIYYKGNPQMKRSSSGGGGSITRRN